MAVLNDTLINGNLNVSGNVSAGSLSSTVQNFIVGGNEFNPIPPGYNNTFWFNYLTNNRTGGTVSQYQMGNGSQGYASVKASTYYNSDGTEVSYSGHSHSFSDITAGNATLGNGGKYLNLRSGTDSYDGGMYYSTPGNEATVFANKNAVTSWIFATTPVTSCTSWTDLVSNDNISMQIKNKSVVINKGIANDTSASYNLDVGGSLHCDTFYCGTMSITANDEINATGSGHNLWLGSRSPTNYVDIGMSGTNHPAIRLHGVTTIDNGSFKVTGLIFGYNYGSGGNNCAAYIWDKPGSYYTGVGANGEQNTIKFGPANADGTWVSDFTQNWRFTGNIYADSDKRLKCNFKIPDINYIDVLNKLKLREYNFKSDSNMDDKIIGLIAQDLKKVLPLKYKRQLVFGDNILAINEGKFPYLLLGGWQEHNKIINKQQSQIDKLKSENKELKSMLKKLMKRVDALENKAKKKK